MYMRPATPAITIPVKRNWVNVRIDDRRSAS